MRWLAATIVLLGASAALVAGIYLRDRDPSWLPPQRTAADFDAHWVAQLRRRPACGKRCSYAVLATRAPTIGWRGSSTAPAPSASTSMFGPST